MAYDNDTFIGIIDQDGVIWEINSGRKRQAVGIDLEKEQEYQKHIDKQQEIIDNYYNHLVELGEIIPPKSAEDIAREQAAQQTAINTELLKAIQGLQSEIKELKGNGKTGVCDGASGESSGQNSQSNQQKSPGRKGGNSSGQKDTSSDS